MEEVKGQPTGSWLLDDLSFESGDARYKVPKSALDGSVYGFPDNVLIYVTSNRRHLVVGVRERQPRGEAVEGELHHGEAVEEKISALRPLRGCGWASTGSARTSTRT